MQIFSKPINETNANNIIKPITADNNNNIFIKNDDILKIDDYFDNNINLNKYKLKDLKPILKYYKLKTTGNKNTLIERIKYFFNSTKSVITIQSWWRKQLVFISIKLRGPALKNRSLCTNLVDFNTLEPIEDINQNNFFSYTGDDNFTYGFYFNSLIELLNRETSPFNPFNREVFNKKTIDNIMKLYRITNILFNDNYNKATTNNFNLHSMDIPEEYSNNGLSFQYFRPKTYCKNTLKNLKRRNCYIKICKNRVEPLKNRVYHIFYLFDSFGNYTQSSWFYSLSFGKLVSFYRQLNDIWNSRSQVIPTINKRKICSLYEPFQLMFSRPLTYNQSQHDESLYNMRVLCITLMENMVMQAIDDEYAKVGALYCLTSLTVVSHAARVTMPWLYESIR
tara:strand:- start:1467 stop:2648 length:1182 start_codon:yes stop_codon:yes gene_type:complete